MPAASLRGRVSAGLLLSTVLAMTPGNADETTFSFGGYIKLDAMYSDYRDGDLGPNSALRDFHIPGAIPVGGISEDPDVDFHAKESRFNFKVRKRTDSGHDLGVFVEMDFLLPVSGDERVSNSYNPRMRHAYFTYDKWLFGQTWSTFMIIVLPDDLDFVGVAEGTTFGRGAQIRYTNGPWQVSLENPETTITPNGGGSRVVADDNSIPELVGRYNHKADRSTVSVAGIYRQLKLDEGSDSADDNGFGLSVGGKVRLAESDDLIFMATAGSGLGRHLGLNAANAAVITATGDLEAIDSTAGFIGLLHRWNEQWRSSVNYSFFDADNDPALTGTSVTKSATSYSVNLLYSPVPKMTVGAEYMHADRELESGLDGDLDRIQFSAKYAFDFSAKN